MDLASVIRSRYRRGRGVRAARRRRRARTRAAIASRWVPLTVETDPTWPQCPRRSAGPAPALLAATLLRGRDRLRRAQLLHCGAAAAGHIWHLQVGGTTPTSSPADGARRCFACARAEERHARRVLRVALRATSRHRISGYVDPETAGPGPRNTSRGSRGVVRDAHRDLELSAPGRARGPTAAAHRVARRRSQFIRRRRTTAARSPAWPVSIEPPRGDGRQRGFRGGHDRGSRDPPVPP